MTKLDLTRQIFQKFNANYDEILSETPEEDIYSIHNILKKGGRHLIAANRGGKKTLTAIKVGKDFAKQIGSYFAYADLDDKGRNDILAMNHKAQTDEVLIYTSYRNMKTFMKDLNPVEFIKTLSKSLPKYSIVLIDALYKVVPDLTKTEQVVMFLESLAQMGADFGHTFIILHHTNKQGNSFGSVFIEAEMSTIYEAENIEADSTTFRNSKLTGAYCKRFIASKPEDGWKDSLLDNDLTIAPDIEAAKEESERSRIKRYVEDYLTNLEDSTVSSTKLASSVALNIKEVEPKNSIGLNKIRTIIKDLFEFTTEFGASNSILYHQIKGSVKLNTQDYTSKMTVATFRNSKLYNLLLDDKEGIKYKKFYLRWLMSVIGYKSGFASYVSKRITIDALRPYIQKFGIIPKEQIHLLMELGFEYTYKE